MPFLHLIRYKNLLMLCLTQVLVRYCLLDKTDFPFEDDFGLLLLSTATIAAAGYIINDYFDVKIDVINKPNKVVVGRKIKRRTAIFLHQILNTVGVFAGFMLGKTIFFLNLLSISLLWFYSERYKQQAFWGNLMVAMLSGLSLFIVAIFYRNSYDLVGMYAFFAFAATLIREILKDIEDIPGDMRHGCRTLPILWGIRRTKQLLYWLIGLFFGSLFVLAGFAKNQPLLYIFCTLSLPISYLVYRILRADTQRDFHFLSQFSKIIMLLGISSMLVL